MSDLFWLTDAQMARLQPFFPEVLRQATRSLPGRALRSNVPRGMIDVC